MRKKEAARRIQTILDDLFPCPKISLRHKDPFTLLIATLLSAQCTDARVNQVTEKLFTLADSAEKMALLSCEAIESIIRTCGLAKTKAKAIRQLSLDLMAHHKGRVPETFIELEQLPGVGHKTASVVISQAFHQPAFPVDTHIHRCAKRWGLSSGTSVKQTEADLKRLFPQTAWNKLHLQIIHFARTYCPAKGHIPSRCPICSTIS